MTHVVEGVCHVHTSFTVHARTSSIPNELRTPTNEHLTASAVTFWPSSSPSSSPCTATGCWNSDTMNPANFIPFDNTEALKTNFDIADKLDASPRSSNVPTQKTHLEDLEHAQLHTSSDKNFSDQEKRGDRSRLFQIIKILDPHWSICSLFFLLKNAANLPLRLHSSEHKKKSVTHFVLQFRKRTPPFRKLTISTSSSSCSTRTSPLPTRRPPLFL